MAGWKLNVSHSCACFGNCSVCSSGTEGSVCKFLEIFSLHTFFLADTLP